MKTYAPSPRDIERRWYVIDADGAVLGRLASEVAGILRGKHKPIFAPHADTGDNVIVVNARGIRLTGGKETKKVAYRHSGYPGGLTAIDYATLLEERPVKAVEKAVRGMLPKNRLGRAMIGKLRVYEGTEHPHGPQKPARLALGEVPAWDGLPTPAEEPVPRERAKPARPKPAAGKTPAKETPPKRSPAKRSPAKAGAVARTAAKAAGAKRPSTKPKRAPKKKGE
jgi:large subunit ribosomal protein L13